MAYRSFHGWLGAVAFLCGHAAAFPTAQNPAAAQAQSAMPVVEVAGLRDVDQKPYRRIFKGMQVFEENHQLAPAASLRFRLHLRSRNASFAGLRVKLSGDTTDIPITLDDDHGFSLPMSAAMAKDDAFLTTNKKPGTYAWRVDIRTPGLPPNTRRLGDLRLECKVDMKGAELRQMVRDPSIMALAAVSDPCTFRTFTNPFFADRPVFNVTLVSGARRESIASEWLYANSTRAMPEAMYELVDWRYTRDRQYPLVEGSKITVLKVIKTNRWPDPDMNLIVRVEGTPLPADVPVRMLASLPISITFPEDLKVCALLGAGFCGAANHELMRGRTTSTFPGWFALAARCGEQQKTKSRQTVEAALAPCSRDRLPFGSCRITRKVMHGAAF